MTLAVQLFGSLEVRVNHATLPSIASRRVGWLLALLVLRRRAPIERDWLAATLWPDSDTPQSLYNLRRALSSLRAALGTDEAGRLTTPTPRTIRLDLGGADCDLCAFDDMVRRRDRASLEVAVSLYRGPLLDGCDEVWAVGERREREEKYLSALENLAASGMPEAAVRALRHVVAASPARASAQRSLMMALADLGDLAAAVQVYRNFRLYLHESQRIKPDAETTALYESLTKAGRQAGQTPLLIEKGPIAPSLRPTNHLPTPLTNLIGREAEVERVATFLVSSRLVTLTGTGGVGKTRLALAISHHLHEEFPDRLPDGVWFTDLAPLTDPAHLTAALTATFGLRGTSGRSSSEALTDFLRPRCLLLVLDNCEHLLSSCAGLARTLLEGCPALHVLATSREPLGVTGEVQWRVPPLSLPGGPGDDPAESDAVRLFVERAFQARPSFALGPQNQDAVAQICLHLDSIPLAIEMAAARTRAMTANEIAARLDDAFCLLSRPGGGGVARHQTLRATLDWSWGLLGKDEQTLLARLSVFAGGCVLEAAETVCAGDGVEQRAVLDLLTSLIDKSLVFYRDGDREGRYRLLETVRQYGADRLTEGGGEAAVRGRHAAWSLALAEWAEPQLTGPQQGIWLARLELEHDNLRKALDLYEQQVEGIDAGLRLAGALSRFWYVRGYWSEGRQRMGQALKATGGPEGIAGPETSTLRAKVLNGAGYLAYKQSDSAVAQALHEESLTIYRQSGNLRGMASSLNNLSNVAQYLGDNAGARALLEECLTIHRQLGDLRGMATSLANLGNVARWQDDFAGARALYEESLTLQRQLQDPLGLALSLDGLGDVAFKQGDNALARSLLEESLAIQRQLGSPIGIAKSLGNLGHVTRQQGDRTAATAYHEAALVVLSQTEDRREILSKIYSLGELAEDGGNLARAEALYSEAWAMDREFGAKTGYALLGLGRVVQRQGDTSRAEALLTDCLAGARDLGLRPLTVWTLQLLAEVAGSRGETARATHLWGTATVMYETFGLTPNPTDPVAAVAPALDEGILDAVCSKIQGLPWDHALEYALTAIPKEPAGMISSSLSQAVPRRSAFHSAAHRQQVADSHLPPEAVAPDT